MKSTTASLLFILAIIAALFGTPAATAASVAAEVEPAEPENELGPTAAVASSSSSFLKKKRELQSGSSSSSSSDTSSMSLMSYGPGPVPVSIYAELLRLRYPRTYTMLYGPRPSMTNYFLLSAAFPFVSQNIFLLTLSLLMLLYLFYAFL